MSERYVSPAAPPTAYERELVELLIEECAEVQQRATKLLRFGPQEVQPGQDAPNAMRLGFEVGDALEIVDRLLAAGLLSQRDIDAGRASKRRQLARFMQHDAPSGGR